MCNDVRVPAFAIRVGEVETNRDAVGIGIRVSIWDLWEAGGGRKADGDGCG